MKLAKIAISIAAVLGVAVIGGSWYTGKQVEQRYTELVTQANESLQSLSHYGVNARFNDVQLERGWFSSDVRYRLEIQAEDKQYQIHGKDKLYHGPLPLNRLMQGNIAPVMASSESQVEVPTQLKTFIEKEVLLSGQGSLTYGGEWQGKYQLSPIKSDWLDLSEVVVETELDQTGKNKGKVNVTTLNIRSPEAGNNVSLGINGIEYDFDMETDHAYPLLNAGNTALKIDSMVVNGLDADVPFTQVTLQDVITHSRNTVKDGRLMGDGDFLATLRLGNEQNMLDFGKFRMRVKAEADAKASNELIHAMNMTNQDSNQEIDLIRDFLRSGLLFDLSELSLENQKGKSQLALLLNLNVDQANQFSNLEDFLQLFKQSQLSITLNQSMAEEVVKQYALLYPAEKVEAEKVAKEEIEKLVKLVKQSELAEIDEAQIKFNMSIDQGKVMLNGKAVPQEQVQGVLFMMMLGLSGL